MWVSNLFLSLRLPQTCPRFYKCNCYSYWIWSSKEIDVFSAERHNNVVSFELRDDTCAIFHLSVLIQFPNTLKNIFIDLGSFTACHWPHIKEHKCCIM